MLKAHLPRIVMDDKSLSFYKILKEMGSAGMDIVYQTEDTKRRRFVALKLLPSELADSSLRDNSFEHVEINIASTDDRDNLLALELVF